MELLVPGLCPGMNCPGGSASRVAADVGAVRCSAGGACGAVRSQAGAWERVGRGEALAAVCSLELLVPGLCPGMNCLGGSASRVAADVSAVRCSAGGACGAVRSQAGAWERVGRGEALSAVCSMDLLVPGLCPGMGCLGGSASRVNSDVGAVRCSAGGACGAVRSQAGAWERVGRGEALAAVYSMDLLVPRLCPGMNCLGGSASRVNSDGGAVRCSAGGACGAVRSQAGAWERVGRGEALAAVYSMDLLVPGLCPGMNCPGGSASRVAADVGAVRCSAGGACGAVRSQAGAWERVGRGEALAAVYSIDLLVPGLCPGMNCLGGSASRVAADVSAVRCSAGGACGAVRSQAGAWERVGRGEALFWPSFPGSAWE
jgi:hypothetical protein